MKNILKHTRNTYGQRREEAESEIFSYEELLAYFTAELSSSLSLSSLQCTFSVSLSVVLAGRHSKKLDTQEKTQSVAVRSRSQRALEIEYCGYKWIWSDYGLAGAALEQSEYRGASMFALCISGETEFCHD